MSDLKGKTLFITGASRGIGLAIALRAAREGANIVIAAKTAEPHPKLPGTIYTAARDIEAAGGNALPLAVDIRFENQVQEAAQRAAWHFGGIDILVNNASAISLTGTTDTAMKRFDLMMGVNLRGTFLCSQACLPYLAKAPNPHILVLSPPLDMRPKWFAPHLAYTISKYAMSMCVLGMAEEFRPLGIAVNALWPRTLIATAALQAIPGAPSERGRIPRIVADAAARILTQPSREATGNFYIDEQVLAQAGVTDFSRYAVEAGQPLVTDLFLE
ncbi:MAG: NAD(P)-dependent oxidoreductase [Terracidiphilus sp.]